MVVGAGIGQSVADTFSVIVTAAGYVPVESRPSQNAGANGRSDAG